MELLKELYYNPKTGLQSKQKLYKKAKERDASITLKKVEDFLQQQATHQITKQVKKNKEYNTIISPSVRNNYQLDIFYLPNPKQNGNYKYLLTCIDVYSRYAFVRKMKTKTGEETIENFKKMITENGVCKNLNIDDGKEFQYKPFTTYCEEKEMKLWISDPEQSNKNAIIERFHRTLRNMILRYEVAKGKRYIDDLPSIIENYNTTEHKTTEEKPIDIWEGKKTNKQDITIVKNEFNVGDKVRHLVKKGTFDKASSTTNYTKKVYTITKVIGKSIFLDDLTKPFKSYEILKAVGDDKTSKYDEKNSSTTRDEKIARRMRKEGIV